MNVYEIYTLLLQIKMLKQHPVLERMIGVHSLDLQKAITHALCKGQAEKIHFDRIFTDWLESDQYPLTEFALASYLANWHYCEGLTQILVNHYRQKICMRHKVPSFLNKIAARAKR